MENEKLLLKYAYELETWKRMLAFFQQEIIFLKNRLTELVQVSDKKEVIEDAERFQENFLEQDKIQEFLLEELKSQIRLLEKEAYLDGVIINEIVINQNKLRKDFEKEEMYFIKVKNEFADYLASV